MNNSQILNIISNIREPFLNLTLNEMGVISRINQATNEIYIELSFPGKYIKDSLLKTIKNALTNYFPHQNFSLTVTQHIKQHLTQLPGKGLRSVKNVIAVASGKGGVGKSTVAVNLAAALGLAGANVGILDADIYGPSIPLMLGCTSPITTQDDKYLPARINNIQAMSIGYLTKNASPLIWRGPMLAKSLIQMLDITLWENLDYLIIDLPPGTGDIQLSLIQKIPLAGAVIISTPQQVATLDAKKALDMFKKTEIFTIGIIENMTQHTCSNCGHIENIFGADGAKKLALDSKCQFLGQIPIHKSITYNCDNGLSVLNFEDSEHASIFMRIALNAAINLSKRPCN